MSVALLNPEDGPQDGLMVDDLPDPYASLDSDMAGDPGPDACEVDSAPVAAAESPRGREAREYEEAFRPYVDALLAPFPSYVADVATEEAMIGGTPEDLASRADAILAEATKRRDMDAFMVREDAERNYRREQLEAAALDLLIRRNTEGGNDR